LRLLRNAYQVYNAINIKIVCVHIQMDKLHRVTVYRMEDVNYIGSTKQTLKERAYKHRHDCFNPNTTHYDVPLYNHIRDNMLGIRLIPIKELFVGKTARKMIEQIYINKYDSINNGLNDRRAYTTRAQKEELDKKYAQKYRKKNKEKRRKKGRKKVKCNRCGSVVRYDSLSKHYKTKKCKRLSQLPK